MCGRLRTMASNICLSLLNNCVHCRPPLSIFQDFPVRAGQFLGGCTLRPAHEQPKSLPAWASPALMPRRRDYDVERFADVPWVQRSCERSVVACACSGPDDPTSPRGCDPAPPCRHEGLRMRSTRLPRNGAPSPNVVVRIFSSSMTAGVGSTTTIAKSSSSIACVRPFAWRKDGPRSHRPWMKSRRGKIKALPRVRIGPRLEARLRVVSRLIRRGRTS
jgi:hypothetical protein